MVEPLPAESTFNWGKHSQGLNDVGDAVTATIGSDDWAYEVVEPIDLDHIKICEL